jgi:hypothetical protein
MWKRVVDLDNPKEDDMAEPWICPKCSGQAYSVRYCIKACRQFPMLDVNGHYHVRNNTSYEVDPKQEHLHTTCNWCGYETLDDCHDKTRVEPPKPAA